MFEWSHLFKFFFVEFRNNKIFFWENKLSLNKYNVLRNMEKGFQFIILSPKASIINNLKPTLLEGRRGKFKPYIRQKPDAECQSDCETLLP